MLLQGLSHLQGQVTAAIEISLGKSLPQREGFSLAQGHSSSVLPRVSLEHPQPPKRGLGFVGMAW